MTDSGTHPLQMVPHPPAARGARTSQDAPQPDPTADRGASLKSRRVAAGLSRPRLAGLADCSVPSIEQIEGGYRPKRSAVLGRLYAALAEIEGFDGGQAAS